MFRAASRLLNGQLSFSWPNPLAASLAWEGLEAHNMELLLEFFHAEGLAIRMKVPPGVVGVHHHNRDCCGHRRQPPSAIGFATSNRWANVPATVPRSRSGHGKFRPLHKAILCRSFNEKLAKDSDLLGPITPFIWANYNDLSRGHLKWWFWKGESFWNMAISWYPMLNFRGVMQQRRKTGWLMLFFWLEVWGSSMLSIVIGDLGGGFKDVFNVHPHSQGNYPIWLRIVLKLLKPPPGTCISNLWPKFGMPKKQIQVLSQLSPPGKPYKSPQGSDS